MTLGYLAVQIRQNTAQQMREETVSIQRGQNEVVSKLNDPAKASESGGMKSKGKWNLCLKSANYLIGNLTIKMIHLYTLTSSGQL